MSRPGLDLCDICAATSAGQTRLYQKRPDTSGLLEAINYGFNLILDELRKPKKVIAVSSSVMDDLTRGL